MSTKITHYIHGDLNSQVANDGDVLAWDDNEKVYRPTKIPAYITTKRVATLPSTPAINTLYLVATGTENVYHQYLQTEDELIDMGLTTIEVTVATDGKTIQENDSKELEVKLNSTGGLTFDSDGLKVKVDSGGLIKNDPTYGLKIDPGTNNAGKVLRVKATGTGAEWKAPVDLIYPVGSVYLSASSSVNPQNLFAGTTWQKIGSVTVQPSASVVDFWQRTA